MTAVHYTSDLHFGHRLVAGLRGFASTDEHDDLVCARWRQAVQPDDTVWVLGDLAVTSSQVRLAGILERNRGAAGDQASDPGQPRHRPPETPGLPSTPADLPGVFASVQVMARRRIDGADVMLSHYAYFGDHSVDDRDIQYRLRDAGRWLLHGHLHTTERVTGPRQIHVGLDAWNLTPVPESEIAWLISGTPSLPA